MSRGLLQLLRCARWRLPLKQWPIPGRCHRCGTWVLLRTNETPAYSAYDGAYLCEPCADQNDEDTRMAWAEYYSGLL
jgi:hypothetical protein